MSLKCNFFYQLNKIYENNIYSLLALIWIFYIVFFLSCCTSLNDPILNQMAPMLSEDYCRIAVLPFLNESQYKQGDTILQKVFIAELIKAGDYSIAQEGDVLKLYQQIKIFSGHSPDYEQFRIISDRLNVQLLITGRIIEMNENLINLNVNPEIALTVQIFDAKTGTILWTTYHRKNGEQYRTLLHFGKINSITTLAQVMTQEMIEKWISEGFRKCTH